jgi:alpha-N-arabinofuranosidase
MNTRLNFLRNHDRSLRATLLAGLLLPGAGFAIAASLETDVRLTVDADHPSHEVHPYVYGHFFEHIYHSANGGLWGELIWNRSFELSQTGIGDWSLEDGELVQSALITDVNFVFGDDSWKDYELTLQGRKDGGAEGFLVLFRAKDADSFYWLNIGGWGNTRHAVEKESDGQRRGVGRGSNGGVETGRWYDIRIRCEGNHIQGWLGDDQIIDLRDGNAPHLSGGIGLGTWGTQARYRHIKVTSLDGSTELFSGVPELPARGFEADFWTHFGTGGAARVRDAVNNEYSVQLSGDGSPTGIEQGNFRFIPQRYEGSVWMKGSDPTRVKVELVDGETVLGSAVLGPPGLGWAEYPFEIRCQGATLDGSVRLTLQGPGTVKLDHVNMMGQDALGDGGFRPDLLDAVRGLRPPIIRWPGGCFASVYLWKDAIGPQHERRIYPAYMWEDQDINSLGTDEYMLLCEKTGAEPLLVINTGVLNAGCGAPAQFRLPSEADYLPYALEWMEYCNGDASTPMGALRAANGHPEPYNVVYWELDNETWAAGVEAYIGKVKAFAPALRAKAEELGLPIKIIACGGSSFDMRWNRSLIDACAPLMDYISVHHYENPDNFASGVPRYENFLVGLAGYIAESDNPAMEIYNSEWNAQSTDWRTGLYAGGLLNAYERQGRKFTLGGPALFLRHTSAGAWDNAFMNFDHTGWFPAPNYVVMKLWWDNYAPHFLPVAGDPHDCNIVATRTESGNVVVLKAVNPTDEARSITVDVKGGFAPSDASMQLVAPGSLRDRNSLADPAVVQPEPGVVQLTGRQAGFELPAWSAAVIRLR